MKTLRTSGKLFLLTFGLVLLQVAISAQQEPPEDPDPYPIPPGGAVIEQPYDPNQPASSENDPGSDKDPSTLFDPLTWEPIAEQKLEVDPSYLDASTLEDQLQAIQAGCTPGPNTFCGPQFYPSPGPLGCYQWNSELTLPIKVYGPARNYFSYRGQLTPLVGASADNACHQVLPATVPPQFYCDQSNHHQVLDQFALKQLNKIRLWVAIGGDGDPVNQPFLRVTDPNHPEYGTFWALDQPKAEYFARLREVVTYARQKGLFVEVTFFAPWIGNFAGFYAGPWGGAARYGSETTGYSNPVRLTRWENFVQANAVGSGFQLIDPSMERAQRSVVEWTIETLWCFDHVYWELANEQENYKCGDSQNPCTALDPAKLQRIANWNQLVIGWIQAKEATYGRVANTRHLVAVQPLTESGAVLALTNPNISVVNGHYSTVLKTDNPQLDLGALSLIRVRGTPQKIFGYNEGKIVQTFVAGDSNTTSGPWTRARRNDNLFWGVAAPARAEAWEFMLNQGGAVDHFGYRYALDNSSALQGQMRQLLLFLRKLRLPELRRSSVPPAFAPPSWIAGWPAYPVGPAGFDSGTKSQRFWAALEPSAAATKRQFVLYVHHSTPRCSGSQEFLPGPGNTSGCSTFLSFGGWNARAWSDSRKYEEFLDLRLGGTQPVTYLLEWFNPPMAGGQAQESTLLHWTPNGSGGSCVETLTPGRCVVRSPRFEYDLAVKITEQ